VLGEVVSPRKRLPTHVTMIRLFSRVDSGVQQESVGERKLFPAHGTREVLLAAVDPEMSTQAARQRKRPTADVAHVRTSRLSRSVAGTGLQ